MAFLRAVGESSLRELLQQPLELKQMFGSAFGVDEYIVYLLYISYGDFMWGSLYPQVL